MTVAYKRLVRSTLTDDEHAELDEVDTLAAFMREHLLTNEAEIDQVHIHQGQSKAIQDIVHRLLVDQLRYLTERPLDLDDVALLSKARPDFTLNLNEGRGVLVEVERGGTTLNNHDLKDFWKTHLAKNAHHLFLVVPNANWAESGKAREKPFVRVSNRLELFFGDERREVDVISVHIFGYGRDN